MRTETYKFTVNNPCKLANIIFSTDKPTYFTNDTAIITVSINSTGNLDLVKPVLRTTFHGLGEPIVQEISFDLPVGALYVNILNLNLMNFNSGIYLLSAEVVDAEDGIVQSSNTRIYVIESATIANLFLGLLISVGIAAAAFRYASGFKEETVKHLKAAATITVVLILLGVLFTFTRQSLSYDAKPLTTLGIIVFFSAMIASIMFSTFQIRPRQMKMFRPSKETKRVVHEEHKRQVPTYKRILHTIERHHGFEEPHEKKIKIQKPRIVEHIMRRHNRAEHKPAKSKKSKFKTSKMTFEQEVRLRMEARSLRKVPERAEEKSRQAERLKSERERAMKRQEERSRAERKRAEEQKVAKRNRLRDQISRKKIEEAKHREAERLRGGQKVMEKKRLEEQRRITENSRLAEQRRKEIEGRKRVEKVRRMQRQRQEEAKIEEQQRKERAERKSKEQKKLEDARQEERLREKQEAKKQEESKKERGRQTRRQEENRRKRQEAEKYRELQGRKRVEAARMKEEARLHEQERIKAEASRVKRMSFEKFHEQWHKEHVRLNRKRRR